MAIKSAETVLPDDRFDNIVVTWPVGKNVLHLCHKGEYVLGPDGKGMKWEPAAVIRKFPIKGGLDHNNVEAEALKIYDSVSSMFEEAKEPALADEWYDD